MDWRDKDYKSLAPKLIYRAYYFRTAIRHECPVQRSLNSYSYDRFGSRLCKNLKITIMVESLNLLLHDLPIGME